jgi:hypothetical protein
MRDIADGVPRSTPEHLKNGMLEQLHMRTESGQKPCM